MQNTSELYQEIIRGKHTFDTRLAVGETGRLITKTGDSITFGGVSILVGASGAEAGYDESILYSMGTSIRMFSEETPTVGSCVSGEIDVVMLRPAGNIPRQARLVPYVRATDGLRHSEWLQKGVYYVDTREVFEDSAGVQSITLHGYDAMLKAEQEYPPSKLQWPARDIEVVREIAKAMDVGIDSRTVELMDQAYIVQYPADYSCREVLGYIASMYGGCFIMSNLGELRLVALYSIPAETRYLITKTGFAITFGGDRILV